EEIVGQTSFLRPRDQANSAWVEDLLRPPARPPSPSPSLSKPAQSAGSARLGHGLAGELSYLVNHGTVPLPGTVRITNADRSIRARLSGDILREFGTTALAAAPVDLGFHGAAGPSFGAFLTSGITFRLSGEANDYVGKGLSGGVIAIDAGAEASLRGDVLAG